MMQVNVYFLVDSHPYPNTGWLDVTAVAVFGSEQSEVTTVLCNRQELPNTLNALEFLIKDHLTKDKRMPTSKQIRQAAMAVDFSDWVAMQDRQPANEYEEEELFSKYAICLEIINR